MLTTSPSSSAKVKNEWSYTSIALSYFLQNLSATGTNPYAQYIWCETVWFDREYLYSPRSNHRHNTGWPGSIS